MDMFGAVKSVFSKYAQFKGRARRSEYWYFVLFNLLVTLILAIIGGFPSKDHFNIWLSIYGLITLCPRLALCWRRLHDIGKSGMYFLVSFIPVVGGWIFMFWAARDSEVGENKYGPSPKFMD